MFQSVTTGIAAANAAALAAGFQAYLGNIGVGVHPTGLSIDASPYEITYSSDAGDPTIYRPFLYVPHLSGPSPLRRLFNATHRYPTAPEDGSIIDVYWRLQDIIDDAMKTAKTSDKADAALHETITNRRDRWNAGSLLRTAVLFSSWGDVQGSIERAADLLIESAGMAKLFPVVSMFPKNSSQHRDAAGLLLQLAYAALSNINGGTDHEGISQRKENTADKLGSAWLHTLSPDHPAPDQSNDCVRIFAGLVGNLSEDGDNSSDNDVLGRYIRTAALLRRSRDLYSKNGRPDLASQDSLRIFLTLLKAASHCASLRDLLFDADSIVDGLTDAGRQMILSNPKLSKELEGFARDATTIADGLALESCAASMDC